MPTYRANLLSHEDRTLRDVRQDLFRVPATGAVGVAVTLSPIKSVFEREITLELQRSFEFFHSFFKAPLFPREV